MSMTFSHGILWALATFFIANPSNALQIEPIPPSPVVLTQNAQGVNVQNVSNQRIVQVSLGCSFTKGRTQFAIHWLLNQEVSLEPQMQVTLADSGTRQEMLQKCQSYYPHYRPGIVVRNVIFADKTGWPPPPRIRGGWAENLKGTPLTMTTTPSGYQVLNTSDRMITDYTVGCIQTKQTHVKVLQRYDQKQVKPLEPGSRIVSSAIDGPAPTSVQDCVLHRKKKMAVVEVRFQDGSIWQPTTKP